MKVDLYLILNNLLLFRILIKGGEVVNETGRERADVYIEDNIIRDIFNKIKKGGRGQRRNPPPRTPPSILYYK